MLVNSDHNVCVALFVCLNPTVGTGHTVTSGMTANGSTAAAAYSGGVSIMKFSGAGNTGGATSLQNSALTPNAANMIAITGLATDGSPLGIQIDSSLTIRQSNPSVQFVNYGVSFADLINPAQASLAPTWSWTNSVVADTLMVVFAEPSATLATITGTITTATEADIVTGGSTIIITLTDGTWATAGAAFDAVRQAIINGLDAADAQQFGWNLQVRDTLPVTSVVRTSDTVVTITLPAEASYSISTAETITVTVPASALSFAVDITATPTFTLEPESQACEASGGISYHLGMTVESGLTHCYGLSPLEGISV